MVRRPFLSPLTPMESIYEYWTTLFHCCSAVYISLLVTLRKLSQRASCKARRWDKVNTIRRVCIVQYRIAFWFQLTKRINHPDLGRVRQKDTILFAFLGWPLSLWPRKQVSKSQISWTRAKMQVNFDPGQEFFSGVKTKSMLVCRLCDFTSGNVNKTCVRWMCRGV